MDTREDKHMEHSDTSEESQNSDPTSLALQNLRSSLPEGYHIKDDFSIGLPSGMVPRQKRESRKENWAGPEMVVQSAFSIQNEFRCLLIYKVLPSGRGELFGYQFDGMLGAPLKDSEPLVARGKEEIAEDQYSMFKDIVEFVLSKFQPDCSLPD